eukprot:3940844-Rhodomonas_salina.2
MVSSARPPPNRHVPAMPGLQPRLDGARRTPTMFPGSQLPGSPFSGLSACPFSGCPWGLSYPKASGSTPRARASAASDPGLALDLLPNRATWPRCERG